MSFNSQLVSNIADESSTDNDFNVSDLQQENDLIVLTNQISPDELIQTEDILTTEALIDSSRQEQKEQQEADNAANANQKGFTITFNIFDIIKRGAINLILPFINGMMLGFGEILAHEIGYKYGWTGAKVLPAQRMDSSSKPSKYL